MGRPKKCRPVGKVKFPTHERALMKIGELQAYGGAKGMTAYKCPFGQHYHLTSNGERD